MNKHKHCDMIMAWAAGETMEFWAPSLHKWTEFTNKNSIDWNFEPTQYRIKPEPKRDVVVYSRVVVKPELTREGIEIQQLILRPRADNPNIKYTFDGETGHLKSAEVL